MKEALVVVYCPSCKHQQHLYKEDFPEGIDNPIQVQCKVCQDTWSVELHFSEG